MYSWSFGIQDNASKGINNMSNALKVAGINAQALKGSLIGLDSTIPTINNVGSSLSSLKGIAMGAMAGIGIGSLGNEVVATLAKFEKMEAVLTNTLGDNSAAKGIMQGITDFAAKTPFQVDELTDSFVKFANQGFAPSIKEMTALGDLASSTGKKFDQLAEAVIDAQTGEFERLKEFGIVAKAVKGTDNLTFSFKNQTATVKNNGEEIRKYLISLGNMKGVGGAMESISATTGGQISNMKDQFDALKLSIGTALKPIIQDTLQTLGTWLVASVKWVKDNQDNFMGWAKNIYDVALAVGTAYITYQGLTLAVSGYNAIMFIATNATSIFSAAQAILNAVLIANPIGVVVMGLAALAGGAVYAYQKIGTFRAFIDGSWEALKTFGTIVYDYAIKPLVALGEIVIGVFTRDMSLIKQGMGHAVEVLHSYSTSMLDVGMKLGTSFTEGWNKGMENFQNANPVQSVTKTSDLEKYYNGDDLGIKDPFAYAKKAVGGGAKPKPSSPDLGLKSRTNEVKGGGGQIKNINQHIGKLVEKIEINVNRANEVDLRKLKDDVLSALLNVSNDFNYQ